MLSMSIHHPDAEEFVTKKQDLTKVTGANISIKLSNEFMFCVCQNQDFIQTFPIKMSLPSTIDINKLEYNELYTHVYKNGEKLYFKKVKALDLWNTIIHCAWNTAEPGILFETNIFNQSPDGIYDHFKMISSNPCGEIPMGPYDSCRLIHQNLTYCVQNKFTENASIDNELLYNITYEATRLADDLIDLEIEYIDKILAVISPEYNITKDNIASLNHEAWVKDNITEFQLWLKIKKNTLAGRRAGLGFTGLADVLAMLNKQYGSKESLECVDNIMQIIFKAQLDCQIDMAITRGAFPAFDAQLETISVNTNDWYKYLNYKYTEECEKMLQYGRRNISWSTLAPTGTVSILTQTSSGIEPVFMPYYVRRRKCSSPSDKVDFIDKVGEKYTEFIVIHSNLKEWIKINYSFLSENGLEDKYNDIEYLQQVFKLSPYYKSTAPEINWESRIKIQSLIQKYITHSISSTINLPTEVTEEDINNIYMSAWKHNLKGITVYRDKCREGILNKIEKPNVLKDRLAPKRPKSLPTDYYEIKVKGEQFIVLVGLLDNKPYEIFTFRPLHPVNIGEHKGEIIKIKKMLYSYNSEYINISDLQLANTNSEEIAATLYTSALLRHGVPLKFIIKTAKKVNDNISSFSSAMCRILAKYIKESEIIGEKCPECGDSLIFEGGCTQCKNCGWSKCS